jgi:23S rRNA pseudouridine2605 synthase
VRINKYIAARLGISRRRADEIIKAGRITVDGIDPSPGTDISDENNVLIDGRALPQEKSFTYVLLNKPAGYVCSRDGQGSLSIYDLLPHSYDHLNPVGRLDKDSSGLLLMTNDGELHNKLTHPSYEKHKEYQVTLGKSLDPKDQALIKNGIALADGDSRLDLTPWQQDDGRGWVVRMHEGRNRQIRRTFHALGYKVVSLHRTVFGDYALGDLESGKFKQL